MRGDRAMPFVKSPQSKKRSTAMVIRGRRTLPSRMLPQTNWLSRWMRRPPAATGSGE